jgi:hypothetical protein
MLNWLRGKPNKQNNTANLVISDDLDNSITKSNKNPDDLSEVNNFFDSLDISGVEETTKVSNNIERTKEPESSEKLRAALKDNQTQANESTYVNFEDTKANLFKGIDQLVLDLSAIKGQEIITNSDLEIIHSSAVQAKNLADIKLVERRIANANLRIDRPLQN